MTCSISMILQGSALFADISTAASFRMFGWHCILTLLFIVVNNRELQCKQPFCYIKTFFKHKFWPTVLWNHFQMLSNEYVLVSLTSCFSLRSRLVSLTSCFSLRSRLWKAHLWFTRSLCLSTVSLANVWKVRRIWVTWPPLPAIADSDMAPPPPASKLSSAWENTRNLVKHSIYLIYVRLILSTITLKGDLAISDLNKVNINSCIFLLLLNVCVTLCAIFNSIF